MTKNTRSQSGTTSRRDFVKTTAAAAVSLSVLTADVRKVRAARTGALRVGLIGCGFRGTGAVVNLMQCGRKEVTLWAMGDLCPDRIESSYELLAQGATDIYDRDDFESLVDRMDVPPERKFSGFDAYQKVIDSGVDMVILACPPHFRPKHLRAAIEAGKHVFMEKPVAVDPAGVRSVIATSKLAEEKGLSIVAGTQRRHDPAYIEIMRRVHRGDIGELVGGQVYFMFPDPPGYLHPRQPGWSDMEWQCRNWYYFVWLSGDFPVEMVIHGIDLVNWAMGSHPVKAIGIGGRIARTASEYGNIYDHFAIEYEYPNGARINYMMTHIENCSRRRSVRIVGTKGTAILGRAIEGENPFLYTGRYPDPKVVEHADLIASIREGKPLNEGRQVAESTLAAIMGRMSAYTGQEVTWDWAMNSSKLDLRPGRYDFTAPAPMRPVAIPGKTKLI